MVRYSNKKPLRVFTAFSGYDSQCLALERLKERRDGFDYELVGWSEIEPNAIKAHNLLFPQWSDRNFGDISKIDWDSALYRLAGNSIVVNCMTLMFENLLYPETEPTTGDQLKLF